MCSLPPNANELQKHTVTVSQHHECCIACLLNWSLVPPKLTHNSTALICSSLTVNSTTYSMGCCDYVHKIIKDYKTPSVVQGNKITCCTKVQKSARLLHKIQEKCVNLRRNSHIKTEEYLLIQILHITIFSNMVRIAQLNKVN